MTSAAEEIAIQPSVAAFFCLHRVIAGEKQAIRAKEDLLSGFAIPRHDSRFSGFAGKDHERRRLPIETIEIT
jgi:hypothetical protein